MIAWFKSFKLAVIIGFVFISSVASYRIKKPLPQIELTGHVSVESLQQQKVTPAQQTIQLSTTPNQKIIQKEEPTSSIQIRFATENDLLELLCLDERVTFEFFKPLYEQYYAHVFKDKDIEKVLRDELVDDLEMFEAAVERQDLKIRTEVLFCAYDLEKKCYAGLIYAYQHQASKDVQLGLLVVDENYRHHGVGKALVLKVFEYYKNVMEYCYVAPMHTGNDKTLAFYKKLGFVRVGPSTFDFLNAYGVPYGVMCDDYRYENKGRMSI